MRGNSHSVAKVLKAGHLTKNPKQILLKQSLRTQQIKI